MNLTVTLDHVGVVGPDQAALAAQYQRLGFTLTPRASTGDGRIDNRCVMLRQGYLELMTMASAGASATLTRFLARYAGAHVIALAVADMDATLARLRRAGIDCPGPEQSERHVDAAMPDAPRARFAHLPVPEQPEARINLIRHLTPELLWQPRFLCHANHVAALRDVILAVPVPADTATRFSRLVGRPAVPDAAGGYALDLSRGRLRVLPPDAMAEPPPALPSIVGVTLATDDGNAAIRHVLTAAAVSHRTEGDVVTIAAADAGGVMLQFSACDSGVE